MKSVITILALTSAVALAACSKFEEKAAPAPAAAPAVSSPAPAASEAAATPAVPVGAVPGPVAPATTETSAPK